MLLKFREEKIHRDEALVQDKLPGESYLLEENKALSEEIELLRARIEKNPEVTRFALENIRLSNQLKMYVQCRSACTHYTFLCEMHTYTF
jgi:kinesin family member 15